MKTFSPQFAPQRERRYPVLTALDMALHWAIHLAALVLTTLALKLMIVATLQHPTVQLVLHRLFG